MDIIDYINDFNKLIDKIANPIYKYDFLQNNYTSIIQPSTIDTLKKIDTNLYKHNFFIYNYDFLNSHKSIEKIIGKINSNLYPKSVTDLMNSVHNTPQWSELAKLAIITNLESSIDYENYEEIITEFNSNIDDINSNVQEFDRNLIFHINKFIEIFSNYLKVNKIANLSFYVFQTLLFAYLGSILFSNSEPNTIITNNIIVNNVVRDKVIAKVNIEKLNLRNYARNKSKIVGVITKDIEVEILKDSIKWAFIIEMNTTNTGWVRKEYLNYIK